MQYTYSHNQVRSKANKAYQTGVMHTGRNYHLVTYFVYMWVVFFGEKPSLFLGRDLEYNPGWQKSHEHLSPLFLFFIR